MTYSFDAAALQRIGLLPRAFVAARAVQMPACARRYDRITASCWNV